MSAAFDKLQELADELTQSSSRPVRIEEGWTSSRNRKKPTIQWVTVPGLLTQLYEAATEPAYRAGGGSDPTNPPESKPPIELAAWSAYDDIVTAVNFWVLSIKATLRETVEGNIRLLLGLASRFDLDTLEALYQEMRTWHRWASVFTGTVARPRRLPFACPSCEQRWTVWVNVEKMLAFCKGCSADWVGDAEVTELGSLMQTAAAA